MKESYGKGLATPADPESCTVGRKAEGEALIGACAGWVLSREIHEPLRGADALGEGGRPHCARRQGETRADLARSETPGMHRNTVLGNREVPRLTAAFAGAVRIGKSKDVRR
jgi:hypothetical protein